MTVKDPRKAFEEALVELGKKNDKIVAVSCDSASGGGLGSFFKDFPQRSVEVGISEQNAVCIAAALSKQDFIPVLVAITPFLTMRAYEQVRDDVGYMNTNVKLVGSGGGLAYSTLGSTHEAVEDIALMRTIPNLTIFSPGDAYEVEQSLKMAVELQGPVYIRMPRQPRPYAAEPEKRNLKVGKAEVLKDGKDIAIFTYGPLTEEALKAAELLQQKGLDAAVVNFMTIKPLDEETIKSYLGKVKMIVTAEEHSVINGFGSAVAQIKASMKASAPIHIMGIQEGSKKTGPYPEVLASYGLSGERIAVNIIEIYKDASK